MSSKKKEVREEGGLRGMSGWRWTDSDDDLRRTKRQGSAGAPPTLGGGG
jgi:hypothetical protein